MDRNSPEWQERLRRERASLKDSPFDNLTAHMNRTTKRGQAIDFDVDQGTLERARVLAATIRREYDARGGVSARERQAATMLLTLADEVERLRPELKPAPEQQ